METGAVSGAAAFSAGGSVLGARTGPQELLLPTGTPQDTESEAPLCGPSPQAWDESGLACSLWGENPGGTCGIQAERRHFPLDIAPTTPPPPTFLWFAIRTFLLPLPCRKEPRCSPERVESLFPPSAGRPTDPLHRAGFFVPSRSLPGSVWAEPVLPHERPFSLTHPIPCLPLLPTVRPSGFGRSRAENDPSLPGPSSGWRWASCWSFLCRRSPRG